MNISIIGGGSWGTTLAQALADNGHNVLIRDINENFVNKINDEHLHPFFNSTIPASIKATLDLSLAVNHSSYIVLCVPTKFMRGVLNEINSLIKDAKLFINVSKGIEPETSFRVSQIVEDEISKEKLKGYVCLSGPSHAEELIYRKLTSLVAASNNNEFAEEVQKLFSNNKYLRVYTTDDVIGVETGGSIKNAIAIVSGILTGMGLGENARAFLISRGMKEMVMIVQVLGGSMETVYGLSGLGDLIVTASSMNSRNFNCGLKIGQGFSIESAVGSINQSVEGIRAIIAAHEIGIKHNLDLPIIDTAYEVVTNKISVNEALSSILSRRLKDEKFW